ncbi:MAG: FHA domain-containing protein, partial [Desulfobacterales bacterium]|nr:FHA domain-containing protein [Desulfobacterales bacterium]
MTTLYVLNGPQSGKSFDLKDGANYIGRSSRDIKIDDPTVSREHLKITAREGRYYVTDLKSRNGTF